MNHSRVLTSLASLACALVVLPSCSDGVTPPAPSPSPSTDTSAAASRANPSDAGASDAMREATSADGTYIVRWEPVGGAIPDAEPFSIRMNVRRCDGASLAEDARVAVDAEMPHHGHGMNLVPSVQRAEGSSATARATATEFLGEGLLFHMSGRWVLAIDVSEHGVSERTQWYVDVE